MADDQLDALKRRRDGLAALQKADPGIGLEKAIEDADAEIEKLNEPDSLRDRRPASIGFVGRSLVNYSKSIAPVLRNLVEPMNHKMEALERRIAAIEAKAARDDGNVDA